VRENLKIAAFRNKRKYDQRVKVAKYLPGDWVWVFYPRRVQGKSPKWQRYYDGPYLVLEAIGDVNNRVQRSNRSRKQVVHVDKMKKYLGQAPTPCNILRDGQEPPGGVDPTPPELTFDDAFFAQLPEIYNPDDDVVTPNITAALDNDEELFPDFPRTTPPVTPEQPRRIIVKPARFRWVKDATDDDSEWYLPTDENWYASDDENWYAPDQPSINTPDLDTTLPGQPSINAPDLDPTPPDQPSINAPDPDPTPPDQPSINTPDPELTTLDQSTLLYAIDRADDIFKMSPECEINLISDEPIIELTKRY